jgi:hypothetical protein
LLGIDREEVALVCRCHRLELVGEGARGERERASKASRICNSTPAAVGSVIGA